MGTVYEICMGIERIPRSISSMCMRNQVEVDFAVSQETAEEAADKR